jgi:hypothetical protein
VKAVRCESGKAVQALLTPIVDTATNGDLPALTLDSREIQSPSGSVLWHLEFRSPDPCLGRVLALFAMESSLISMLSIIVVRLYISATYLISVASPSYL